MRIKNALVYTVEHGFVEQDVRIKNGCFAESEAAGTDGEALPISFFNSTSLI